ncbi:hypothetical protein JOQ06_025952, partial [Pogonophryne albipinna]
MATAKHKMHDVVPLKEAYEGKKAELGKTEAEIRQMIEEKQQRIRKVQRTVNYSEKRAEEEKEIGKQSFSSGRFYFEVQVKEKTMWTLGVARGSINRKENIPLSPEEGYWTIRLRNGNEYEALNVPRVLLSLKSQPQKVGVFVDYKEGLVSFYDVEAPALIYSFTGCSFTEKLFLDYLFKLLLIGDSSVGKTNLLLRFA